MKIHHNGLKANAELPDHTPEATLDLYRRQGWAEGHRKDFSDALEGVNDNTDKPARGRK